MLSATLEEEVKQHARQLDSIMKILLKNLVDLTSEMTRLREDFEARFDRLESRLDRLESEVRADLKEVLARLPVK
jgi:hypothetical protein